MAACPQDADIYRLESSESQSVVVSITTGEELTVSVVDVLNGVLVDTTTGGGEQTIDVQHGEYLVKVELAFDDTTKKVGVQYSLDLQ